MVLPIDKPLDYCYRGITYQQTPQLTPNQITEDHIKFFKTAYCFTDSQRNTSYEGWISENVKDKIVIDLGAGSGILCYFAVMYGAKKVYALERRPEMIDRMKEILGDTVEYIHGDLLETELPECDIYLHEWLTSELWSEERFLTNFYRKGHKELDVGHILDLVEYATKHNFIDKLYPNKIELSDIRGESIPKDIGLDSHSKYSKQFLQDYYPDIKQNWVYGNNVHYKKVVWEGAFKDLKHYISSDIRNYLGWIFTFDGRYQLSNHLPVSHWGLKHNTI